MASPTFPANSIQPILESQAGDLREVARIASQERYIVGQGNAGDFQIHRTDADAFASKAHEQVGGSSVPREHGPRGEKINAALEPLISKNLLVRVGEAMDFSEPGALRLL